MKCNTRLKTVVVIDDLKIPYKQKKPTHLNGWETFNKGKQVLYRKTDSVDSGVIKVKLIG